MFKDIWLTLAAIDVSKKIEKKGNLSYLSWAWAWAELMKHYPQAVYEFMEPKTYSDGSVEVWCTVSIDDCKRTMWLPVMDHKNKSILSPTSRDVSDSRMRCLTKCLAMFGLGHYIYAGEDLPDSEITIVKAEDEYKALCDRLADSIIVIKQGISSGNLSKAQEAWAELSEEEKMGLWKAPRKGGCFTTREREVMKSPEFRTANFIAA